MPQLEDQITQAFDEQGDLAESIDGFLPRKAQTDMALAVGNSMQEETALIAEAGTGTGKTYAYLVPALLYEGKTILSTGTKNLQEQLYHRDLPKVKTALASSKTVALLKGRANYLCVHRLSQHGGGATLVDKQTLNELSIVRQWANTTSKGDIGELTTLPEDAQVIPFVTSTVDNCLGRDCPDYEQCYLVQARREAMDADIVVVNHHLFFADLALKDTGFGELIPEVDAVVFDEAHQIPDIACDYFGEAVSTRQCVDLARDIHILYRTDLPDAEQLDKAAQKCQHSANELRLCFPTYPQKGNWRHMLKKPEIEQSIARLSESLKVLREVAKLHLGRNKELDTMYDRIVQIRERLLQICDVQQVDVSLWFETTKRHAILHLTPLSVAQRFRQIVEESERSWIFTSATLTVNQSFGHFQARMGMENATTLMLDSPFNYEKQALLCVPRYLPEPNKQAMLDHLVSIAKKLIRASDGRCFLLFTSHAMLRKVAETLSEDATYPLLVQGTTSKRQLLARFLSESNAVLLGTGAFWEGVDVQGTALVCVLIDKLPFASPDDPLLQARIEDASKKGEQPFETIQIPQAVITLKQGAGRLIRDGEDKGVLVICDSRLVTHGYAQTFLSSLPPMRRTRDLSEVESFLEAL